MIPSAVRKGRKRFRREGDRRELPWVRRVVAATLAGGFLAAAAAFFFRQGWLALGLAAGSLLDVLNLYSLLLLTERTLRKAPKDGQRIFWFWNSLRWLALASACWLLFLVSPFCLAGAVAGYLWFLMALGWAGWRADSDEDGPGTKISRI